MFDLKKILRIAFLIFAFLVSSRELFSQVNCNFTLASDSGCIPLAILATPSDTAPNIIQRKWTLTTCAGAFVTSTPVALNPTFSFIPSAPGCYCLRLWVKNSLGDTCSYQHCNIIISDIPHLTSSVSPASFCAPKTVTLNLNSLPGCGGFTKTTVQWGCGNINTFLGIPPTTVTHDYAISCNPSCYNVNVVMTNSCGCTGTFLLTGAVCVLQVPHANFTVDSSSGVCVSSVTTHFVADSSGPNFNYCWYINGSSTPTQCGLSRFWTHTFPSAGTCYDIKLVVSNSGGCADSLTRTNFVCSFTSPHLGFNLDTSSICLDPGQTGLLCLHDTSSPYLPSPIWHIKVGSTVITTTGRNPCVPISTVGCYDVTLVGSYGPNCTDSLTKTNAFCVKLNPTPCFTSDDSFSCNPQLCTGFHNCSTAPPGSTYLWNFGAGAVGGNNTALNPTPPNVCYYGLGKRDVSLSITSTNGCFKKLTKYNYIVVDTVNAIIYVSVPSGCKPLLTIPQSITNVPPGAPYSVVFYRWWGYLHGTNIPAWGPANFPHYGSAFPITFYNPGCIDLKLEVTTNTGCVTTTWDTSAVCVADTPVCTLTVVKDTMCYEGDSACFTLSGTNCNCDRFIVHFGDETPPILSSNQSSHTFCHTYVSFGEFDAWVIPVKDSCEGNKIFHHIVVYPPAANFISATSCLSGDTVCFTNQTLGANRYHWNFGCRPDTFNTFSPCLLLPHCDTCTVTLTAYNDTTHCIHHKTLQILSACSGVTASLSPDTLIGCGGFGTTTFTNITPGASAGTTEWFWRTNAGNQYAQGISASKNFYPGVYRPVMVYHAPGGCIDSAFGYVQSCAMHVDFGPRSLCLPDSFHFVAYPFDTVASGVGCDSIVSYRWDFGGGIIDTTKAPVHFFYAGTYSVKLVVKNIFGCTDSITHFVVAGTPVYTYVTVDSNLCPGSTVCITNNTSSGVTLVERWELPGSNLPGDTFIGHSPPCLTYFNSGDFQLVYTVTGGTCYKSDTIGMHVHNPVLSGYLTQTYATCPPLFSCGVNTSTGVDSLTDTYTWDFGNKEYLQVNPCDFYATAGTFVCTLTVVTNNGCVDTAIIDTVVIDGPYGTISHSPNGLCSCVDSVDIKITSVKATVLTFLYGCYQGFFIDSPVTPIGTDLNPNVFNFRIPYCLTDSCRPQVTFGDTTGCRVLYSDSLVYIDSPVVKMNFNNYGICLSGTVNFFDATTYHFQHDTSYTASWYWDFGDTANPTATSTLQNPTHYYSQPGAYPVKLIVRSNFGCVDSIVNTSVVVIPKFPIAGFYADDSLICATTSTCFHDTSFIDPNTGPQFWYWDFGDGVKDSVQGANPCHVYNTGGYYTVHLCIYDSIGCGDCDSGFVIRVISNPIANAGPDTIFCYGVQVQLNGSGSTSCAWTPANLVSNAAICNPTTLIFQDTSFVLTVTDTFGCFGKDTLRAMVANVFADFNVTPTSCLDDSVCVTDASTNINGVLTYWSYNFGTGDSIQSANACYKYPTAGGYFIIETVKDNHGCMDTTQRPVVIYPQPMAAFSLNDTVICSDQTVCFTDLSTSITTIQTWNWTFGPNQGGFSGANPPCHLFTPPFFPTYPVVLAVTDLNLCHDTATIIVTVNEVPHANFNWSTSCEDSNMPLSSTSTNGDGAIDSCIWLLWVGAPSPVNSYNCNTTFHFPPGLHDVQLVVHDLNGCLDTIVKTVITDSLTQLVIYPGDTTICLGTSVDYHVSGVFDNIVWSPNVWISNPYSPVVTISPLGNIGYIVSAVNGVCNSDNDTFSIQVIQPIPIEVNATPDRIVLGLSSNIISQIAGQIDSIVWSPDSTLDCHNCPNPVAMPKQTTTYCATIYYGKNGVTCTNPACVTITVLSSCDQSIVYLPNTFTPNGDGINDIFMIRGIAATKINYFRIFDRWGKLVYEGLKGEANQPTWGWNGTDRNGEQLNPAVFVYTYEIECINHEIITGKGNVTLVR